MKNIAKVFAKVSRILGIVFTAICAFGLLITTIVFTVSLIQLLSKSPTQEDIAAFTAGSIVAFTCFTVGLTSSILGLVFSWVLEKRLDTAKSKDELIAPSVLVIIFGFLPAGILPLCIPNSQFEPKVSQSSAAAEEVVGEVVDR